MTNEQFRDNLLSQYSAEFEEWLHKYHSAIFSFKPEAFRALVHKTHGLWVSGKLA